VAELLFYLLGALALLGALGVVLAKSPMAAVLSLLASFFALAVIYLLAGFQFLAAVQILVYAGAILVLFLFVIMLLNLGGPVTGVDLQRGLLGARPGRIALGIAVAVGLGLLFVVRDTALPPLHPATGQEGIDALRPLAVALFGRYGLPFEAASMLLLGTIVAVILLAKRQRTPPRGAPTGLARPTRYAFGRPVERRSAEPDDQPVGSAPGDERR
jgi:NADH-quinone oxidoreductase subunit J